MLIHLSVWPRKTCHQIAKEVTSIPTKEAVLTTAKASYLTLFDSLEQKKGIVPSIFKTQT